MFFKVPLVQHAMFGMTLDDKRVKGSDSLSLPIYIYIPMKIAMVGNTVAVFRPRFGPMIGKLHVQTHIVGHIYIPYDPTISPSCGWLMFGSWHHLS